MTDTDLLTAEQTAAILQLSPHTLKVLRMKHQGPPFIRLGRTIRYRRSELERHLELATVRPR